MNVVVAIDSFKGSLSSTQAGNAVREAVLSLDKEASVEVFPLADGGEGTVDALSSVGNAEIVEITVKGPLLNPTPAKYCIMRETDTAVIEMASASGITLISPEERNPLKATTYGVGELINDAIEKGCRRFIVGIGGSATNDGGTGMLRALGFMFLDKEGEEIPPGAGGLKNLDRIDSSKVNPKLEECYFQIACDVNNPLCGENGCSAIFGPQKGATKEMIEDMDFYLKNYSKIAKGVSEKADENFPGAGAAGGLGFAFLSFMNATLRSGIKIVLDEIGIEEAIKRADIVITGEGRLDKQTVMGKAPIGVANIAKKYDKKVIAFCGSATDEAALCNDHGIDAFFPILRGVVSLDEALDVKNAYDNLYKTATQVFRLLTL